MCYTRCDDIIDFINWETVYDDTESNVKTSSYIIHYEKFISSSSPYIMLPISLLSFSLLIICCQGKPNLLLLRLARAIFARTTIPIEARLLLLLFETTGQLLWFNWLWVLSGLFQEIIYKKASCEGKSSVVASLQFQVSLRQVPISNSWKYIPIFSPSQA